MSHKNDIYNKILREYDALRSQNSARQKIKYNEVCEKLPRIREIDKEIENLGINATKQSILTPKSTDSICLELKEKTSVLSAERKALLKGAGYPDNYLDPEYSCPICKDTGYTGSKKCVCFKNKLLMESYTVSSLGNIIESENFGTFDLNCYSDIFIPEHNASPRENMLSIVNKAKAFCKDPNGENLLFYGGPGLGKTFLCSCIAKELMDKGETIIYTTGWQLFQKISDAVFRSEDSEDTYSDVMEDILTCDLLIIDDLGTEHINSFTSAEFFNIINQRLNNNRSVILSTNLSPEELYDKYSERAVSRIMGGYKALLFFGDDIRIQKIYS